MNVSLQNIDKVSALLTVKLEKDNTNNMKPERLHGKKNVNKERRKRFPSSFNQRT